MVSDQGRLSYVEKTAVTAARGVTAMQIASLEGVTAIAADVRNQSLYYYDRERKVSCLLNVCVSLFCFHDHNLVVL